MMLVQLDPADIRNGLALANPLSDLALEEDRHPTISVRVLRGAPVKLTLQPSGAASPLRGRDLRSSYQYVTARRPGRRAVQLQPRALDDGPCGPRTTYYSPHWLPGQTEVSLEALEEGPWTLHVKSKAWKPLEIPIEVRAGQVTRVQARLHPAP